MAAITSTNVAQAIVKLVAADALPALMGNLIMGNLVNRNYEPESDVLSSLLWSYAVHSIGTQETRLPVRCGPLSLWRQLVANFQGAKKGRDRSRARVAATIPAAAPPRLRLPLAGVAF